jgi:hypothetical protein
MARGHGQLKLAETIDPMVEIAGAIVNGISLP